MVILSHLLTLICIVAIVWIVIRWGAVICFAYAIFYFCIGQWWSAAFCFALACFISLVTALARWLDGPRCYLRRLQ